MYPFVESHQRDQWEQYANASRGWIDESLDIMEQDPDWLGPIQREYNYTYNIYGDTMDHPEPYDYMNNYAPSWQVHPMVPSSGTPNYDMWQIESIAQAFLHAFEHKAVVISPPINMGYEGAEGMSYWASSFMPGETFEKASEPFSTTSYPIYDSLENVRLDVSKEQPLVGVLTFSIYWRKLIENILPEGSEGLVVVFESACSSDLKISFSYLLSGPEAVYLGEGDLHDEKFNEMVHHRPLSELASARDADDKSYTGLPLSGTFCPWTLHVYPSNIMENDHLTKDPMIFAIISAFIFLFASIIFLLYDFTVGRRQRVVLQHALTSGAIVSNLFPEKVKKQLYEEHLKEKQKQKGLGVQESFLSSGHQPSDISGDERGTSSKPLAELFEETTILFADMATFTKWSSTRTPSEVFELLETVYGRFGKRVNNYVELFMNVSTSLSRAHLQLRSFI